MKLLIVDDHKLFAAGLKLLLAPAIPNLEATCCVRGSEALTLARETAFDLVLLDWKLGTEPSGAELIAALKVVAPMARVVIVSGESSAMTVREALDAGASGFVPKESSPEQLVEALAASAHGVYVPPAVLGVLLRRRHSPAASQPVSTGSQGAGVAPTGMISIAQAFPELTPRRAEVLELLARGLSNRQIAKVLVIDEDTVKQHLNKAYAVLGVSSRTEAVCLLARKKVRFS